MAGQCAWTTAPRVPAMEELAAASGAAVVVAVAVAAVHAVVLDAVVLLVLVPTATGAASLSSRARRLPSKVGSVGSVPHATGSV